MTLPLKLLAYAAMLKEIKPALVFECPVCGRTASASGSVREKRFQYIHEQDGSHTLKIRRIN